MCSSARKRQQATLLSHSAGPMARRAVPRHEQQPPRLSLEQLEANAALLRRQTEIEQELQLARDLQQGLLLEAVPRIPGWEFSAISLPARDLGGDVYDFLPASGGHQGIMIGDVSGKGLPAALRMAVARTVFRHEARRGGAPATTLARVNRGVLRDIPHGMVTMLYAQLDPRAGSLVLANAGHHYPVLINGATRELELSGLPLGVDGESAYTQLRVVLDPGAMMVFYTDGVIEATNPQRELFGYEQLERLVATNGQLKPRAIVALVLNRLRMWLAGSPQDDDVTLVVVRRRLARISDELWEVGQDVLGHDRASALWNELPHVADATVERWTQLLPDIIARAQETCGRGLARELQHQFRLVIDEYRELPPTAEH